MLEITDFSNRRGAVVPLLPKIHAMLAASANKDTVAGLKPPANYILWKQEISKQLIDISRRWVTVMDGTDVAGLLFYRFDAKGENIYVDELRIAWAYRNNNNVITLLHDRFINDNSVKKASAVFAGANVKREANQEILATVGFEATFADGLEPLGKPADAAAAFKLRYSRS
jgi:hypothetical protein